ncbi:cytochrome B [Sphingomonas sp. C8-2]|jgi:cytochrome b|nr:cytochrome B [Sphingomonas sp. C8-2]
MTTRPPLNSLEATAGDDRHPRRWDPVVKTTHWSIVAAVLVNALVTEEGTGAHIWVGYALSAVLALRLLWGFIGPPEARFSAFLPSLRRAFRHVRNIRAGRKEIHVSHNPLGALMVYAVWSTLGVIIASGIAMAGPPPIASLGQPGTPPAAVERSDASSDHGDEDEEHKDRQGEDGLWSEVHEIAVNILYVLILLHIAGVMFETRRSGREILLAMLPSRS